MKKKSFDNFISPNEETENGVLPFIESLVKKFSDEISKTRFDEIEIRAHVGVILSLLKQLRGCSVSSTNIFLTTYSNRSFLLLKKR